VRVLDGFRRRRPGEPGRALPISQDERERERERERESTRGARIACMRTAPYDAAEWRLAAYASWKRLCPLRAAGKPKLPRGPMTGIAIFEVVR
jgi:hypothetical protein